jgi:hypothetical protein
VSPRKDKYGRHEDGWGIGVGKPDETEAVQPQDDEASKKGGVRKKLKRVARDAIVRRTSTKG